MCLLNRKPIFAMLYEGNCNTAKKTVEICKCSEMQPNVFGIICNISGYGSNTILKLRIFPCIAKTPLGLLTPFLWFFKFRF
jgi:hypothetical protein